MASARLSGIFIFTVATLLMGCRGAHSSLMTKKYAPAELKEDAEIMSKVLLEMHPGIGIYNSKMYYEKLFGEFNSSLNDSLTEKDFRLKLKLLLDEVHCGHTEVLYSNAFYREMKHQRLNVSPYVFLPLKERLFVVANLNKKQDSTLRKGIEIGSINGIAVDSMIRHAKRFVSTDGYNRSGKDHYIQIGFNSYFLGLFGRPDTFEVSYREGKKTKSLRYGAIRPKSLPPLPLGAKDDSLFIKYRSSNMSYRYLNSDKKHLLLKIERFSHRGDMISYRRIFRKLKKNKSESLTLDLRNNGGGSLANSYRLLSYLMDTVTTQTLRTTIRKYPEKRYTSGCLAFKFTRVAYRIIGRHERRNDTDYFVYKIKPKRRLHFDGKVFVLINGGSFSASCLVASYLRTKKGVTFIGEETGGAQEGCNAGITPFYRLPNTGLRIRVPAFRIIHDANPIITGRGVLPDYPVEYGLKDIFNRRDLELIKVKELLNLPQ